MSDLDDVVRARRSARMFLRDGRVDRALLDEALDVAMRAPSNSNTQPWQVYLASGARRDRLAAALLAAVDDTPPAIQSAGLPERFADRRRQAGALIYGSMGIARDDVAGRWAAQRRNWDFFGAPVAGVVCMHRDFALVDAMGVGMFLQTLLLALTERGIDSCVQVSIALYPDVVRDQLDIPDDLTLLCGLAIGHADPTFAANHLDVPRDRIADHVTFLEG